MKYDFIDEIIIRDNSKAKNIKCYARYTSKAKNRYIYVQDDDCINHDIQKLYDEFFRKPDNIVHGGTEGYMLELDKNRKGKNQMAMVGWGAFIDRRWIKELDKYIDKYGRDYCFYRESDRILSVLMNKHHKVIECNIEHLDNDKHAMCAQPEHIKYKELSMKRARTLLHDKRN